MPNRSNHHALVWAFIAILVTGLITFVWSQDLYDKGRGFPSTYQPGGPGVDVDGSLQIPGHVELNACVRFTDGSGNTCLCRDTTTEQVWQETDCDGVFEGGVEFYLGSGGGGGGINKVNTDAVSEAAAYIFGDGDSGWKLWGEGGSAFLKSFCDSGDCPAEILIPSGETLTIRNSAGDPILSVTPGAASPNEIFQFHPGFEPLVSSEVVLRPLGDCSVVEESVVTSDPIEEWITCADTTGDAIAFNYRVTTKISTDIAAKITLLAVNKNASPSGTFTLACAAQSVRAGLDAYAAHNTTGQQNASFTTFDTQSRPEEASATFTVNGTVATGSHIKGQCNVTAAPAQIADIRLLATGVIELSANSLSD